MIQTERLILRQYLESDLDNVISLYSDKEIMKYIPAPVIDHEMARSRLNIYIADWDIEPRENYHMVVTCKKTNEKIGKAAIVRNYYEDSAMIGWLLIKSVWGKGFATEIANALIEYCFSNLHIHRVYALCHPDNIGSWKVMEKCGMHREAHHVRKCKYTRLNSTTWEDELEYAVINPDD